ncbi:TPM domain-containing protein [Phenylobacterium deserti]|uniref:TPM domain-containing protein n=1 Tax=Phenylobacterium deserti TaxID=1914756 RepID=A0A328AQS2_9CAUL|nr:TPM domain-containing protein [Phenylobacterium deserti]RAK56929.1 TPM domain-containing protein [Phenylobacterium deserti]
MTLTPSDVSAIQAAVREAEARTTGEIYCVVAEESSDYGETPLAWAAGVALLGPAILLLAGVHVSAPDLLGGWSAVQAGALAERAARDALLGAVMLQAVLFAATFLLASIPAVRRVLTPRPFKRERVRRLAQAQFLAKNLHQTRERTGVLIFVSFAEHMAEIIADEGIASQVEPGVWDRAMAALVAGLKRGEPAAGFAAAVGLCADILAERFPARTDNPNELPDMVVILPRV